MTGPAHYNRAEQLLDEVERNFDQRGDVPERFRGKLAAAQVHAALALAAATALDSPVDARGWADVAGTKLSGT